MILFLACCSLLVLGIQSATTPSMTVTHAHNHHSKDPNERESFQFRYDGSRHTLIVRVTDECYIMKLTDAQKAKVHDPDAIRKIEAHALSLIANRTHQKDVDQTTLNHHLQHDCNGATKVIQLANKLHHNGHNTTPTA